jgi:sugar/nucleoside kinase (ribokinase family)
VSPRVLTVGETMVLLDPVGDQLDYGSTLTLRVAGAESNFAIALARLGVPVAWVSRVGDDPLGEVVRSTIAGEGVDVSHVRVDPAPTGVFFKWREDGRSFPLYYRRGSAAAQLKPGDVPDAALEGVELVHLTGITTALGDGPRALVLELAERARARGAIVTFDPNFRPALWADAGEAARAQAQVLPFVDWYLCGLDEGRALFGVRSAEEIVEAAGATEVVVRLGSRGALVRGVEVAPERVEDVVDEVGAGDAFAAGFAYGLLKGWTPDRSARAANLLAAHALRGTGDWETLPHLAELRV